MYNFLLGDRIKKIKETEKRIAALEKEIAIDDYKITKSAEYFLVGKAVPYDVAALSEKRDISRAEIEEARILLSNLKTELANHQANIMRNANPSE